MEYYFCGSMATVPVYKDFWFKIIGSIVASQIIDAINREESFFQRLTTSYFYTDLLGGFAIALLLWEVTRYATKQLDKRYSWIEKPAQRILLQILFGVAGPALLSFFLTMGFMKFAYGQDIFQTQWLYNEFYSVILIIVLINVIYFAWWLYLMKPAAAAAPAMAYENGTLPKNPKQTIEVAKAGKTILLPQEEISSANLSDGYCYIKIFQGDTFVTSYTLEEVEQMLDRNFFFRANRQILVSRKACQSYKSIENGKIELDLQPALKSTVIVSQKRASEFRKWIASV